MHLYGDSVNVFEYLNVQHNLTAYIMHKYIKQFYENLHIGHKLLGRHFATSLYNKPDTALLKATKGSSEYQLHV